MLDRLIHALVQSKNEAADDLLLQALRLGTAPEQQVALDALLKRTTSRGLNGIIARYDSLPEALQHSVLRNIRLFHHALAECARSEEQQMRLAALRLIALGRQGKLAYALSENLHDSDESLAKASVDAILALARWAAVETRRLQPDEDAGTRRRGDAETAESKDKGTMGLGDKEAERAVASVPLSPRPRVSASDPSNDSESTTRSSTYDDLMSQRPEIESAVARASNLHRGKQGQDLLRAALLLADWPGSKTLAILQTTKHGGQSAMVRRLQQPPDSEHVEAFLLGASHGQLRSHFGVAFSHIDQAPVLDALLRKTHWLKDQQLQLCIHQVTRGTWWGVVELARDIERRTASDAARIAEWLAVSGIHDVEQDERMQLLLDRAGREGDVTAPDSVSARLRLLRVAMRRRRGASVKLLRSLLTDPDERIVRMAARELVRRRPADFENMLLKLMAGAPASVRRVIGRAIGQAGFDSFWMRFDRLDKQTRQQAGKAMLKLLPDAAQRLQRRAVAGPPDQRVKAMQIAQELGIADGLRHVLAQLCADPSAKVRSKAVSVIAQVPALPNDVLIDRLLHDTDARVRANAIEVLEQRQDPQFLPLLTERALAASGRERANAIKALHHMKVSTASAQLLAMLRDERSEHRISALWALRQIGWWQLLNEVGNIAKADGNLRVRRYALAVLKSVAELLREKKNAG